MRKFDTPERLSRVTVALHWIVAVSFIAMLIFGNVIEDMERSPEKFQLLGLHKAFGVTLLVLIVLRIVWRMFQGFPTSQFEAKAWQHRLAIGAHVALLAGTLVMPISGVLMSVSNGRAVNVFNLFSIPGWIEPNKGIASVAHTVHGLAANVLIALIALHVAAALWHHLVRKDEVLRRMLQFRSKSS